MTGYPSYLKSKSKKEPKKSELDRKLKFVNIFLVAVIAILGSCYVALTNDLTIKGIEVRALKSDYSSLTEKNRSLNVRANSLRAHQNVAQRTQDLKMVSVDNVNYIKVPADILAKK